MNANELADVMEKYSVAGFMTPLVDEFKQAATMLRQQQTKLEKLQGLLREYTALHMKQQAEIEALKLQLHTTLTNRDLRTYDGKAQEK